MAALREQWGGTLPYWMARRDHIVVLVRPSAGHPPGDGYEWCALGPDGLPCAIGTPPEQEPSERERLLAALVQSERRCRAATKWTIESSRAHDERALAAMALLDHIIAEEDANDAR